MAAADDPAPVDCVFVVDICVWGLLFIMEVLSEGAQLGQASLVAILRCLVRFDYGEEVDSLTK